jgi:hypothetical protein
VAGNDLRINWSYLEESSQFIDIDVSDNHRPGDSLRGLPYLRRQHVICCWKLRIRLTLNISPRLAGIPKRVCPISVRHQAAVRFVGRERVALSIYADVFEASKNEWGSSSLNIWNKKFSPISPYPKCWVVQTSENDIAFLQGETKVRHYFHYI